VRVGLHTGTAFLTEEGYVGADVHRAARIAAAGDGGQVVVSASTAALVDGTDLVDLGEHRFKDLAAPERIYQVGSEEFPPLRSLYRTNLPVPATPFLGRERELGEVMELLVGGDVRLLTLTGPGGTGKTRLALQAVAEVSDRYPDGVFWVPLAPLRNPALVLEQAAAALGSAEELSGVVAGKRMLLLFDNFEHVLEAGTVVGELLRACPNLDVVVTSRELLQLQAEHTYSVPALGAEDGMELFLARARASASELDADETVRALCERLDNLPLALELAASRTRHLTPEQLLGRLSERLDLLKGGRDADPRQQTLRATIAWSYDLLEQREQEAFARLAVFSGGCTLEAVEAVVGAGLDVLASLVDKSLLRKTGDRFWMLETIREFAAELHQALGDVELLRRRHVEYLLGLAGTLGFTVESIEAGATQRHDVAIAEHNNVRAAIAWALDADPVLGLRLATTLENFWISYSPFEAQRMFEELVERIDDMPLELEAMATRCRGNFAIFTDGPKERGLQLYEESLRQYQRLGDEHAQAILEHRLGLNLYRSGELERGRALEERSLARSRQHGFRINEAMITGSLGELQYRDGNVDAGLELMVQALGLAREVGFKWMEANHLNALAEYTFEQDRLDEAERYARAALVVARDMGDRRHAVQALGLLAVLASGRGEQERAGCLWGAVETIERTGALGQRPRLASWEDDRQRFAAAVLAAPGPQLEKGLRAGRVLTLDQAVGAALGES
jgi:predicted ATPase